MAKDAGGLDDVGYFVGPSATGFGHHARQFQGNPTYVHVRQGALAWEDHALSCPWLCIGMNNEWKKIMA